MRLRNIPGADEAVSNSPWVIQDAETKKGKWSEATVHLRKHVCGCDGYH